MVEGREQQLLHRGHEVTLDHFDSVISRDQTCKLGIEWDLCASAHCTSYLSVLI
jgi:hypothetical protein